MARTAATRLRTMGITVLAIGAAALTLGIWMVVRRGTQVIIDRDTGVVLGGRARLTAAGLTF